MCQQFNCFSTTFHVVIVEFSFCFGFCTLTVRVVTTVTLLLCYPLLLLRLLTTHTRICLHCCGLFFRIFTYSFVLMLFYLLLAELQIGAKSR